MKFNINNYITIKLTDRGKDILRNDLRGRFYLERKLVKNGILRLQMWEAFNIFGKYIYHGCQPPFEVVIEVHNG